MNVNSSSKWVGEPDYPTQYHVDAELPVTMLMEGGPHDNVDEDAQARCDQHCLGLDHELLVDHPENQMDLFAHAQIQ